MHGAVGGRKSSGLFAPNCCGQNGHQAYYEAEFLFLDEPTSALDPETTENMMLLFRRLADEGRIVVMVTHKFEKFNSMHNIVLLTKGGRLAFFGPPQEALSDLIARSRPIKSLRRVIQRENLGRESSRFIKPNSVKIRRLFSRVSAEMEHCGNGNGNNFRVGNFYSTIFPMSARLEKIIDKA